MPQEIDNRGSHYWLARYWSEELAKQGEDATLKSAFEAAAKEFADAEEKILKDRGGSAGASCVCV